MAIGNYGDYPDGEQCVQKILAVSKNTGILGIALGSFDVLMKTKPQGYVPTIITYGRNIVPVMGAGLAFSMMACAATNIRGKDDKINYFIGGASAGGIFGVTARSFAVGMPAAFFLGCLAAIYKDSKDNGWEFFPQSPHKMGSIDWRKGDYTLTKER